MKLKLNREYAFRHGFVALLLAAMGAWFGYDGFVTYPSMTPEALYASCHKGEPPASAEAAAKFRDTAIPRQKQFMALCLAAAAVVGLRLAKSARFRFEYGDGWFAAGDGGRTPLSEVKGVDLSRWDSKGIMRIATAKGAVTLDSWHHVGVDGFRAELEKAGLLKG